VLCGAGKVTGAEPAKASSPARPRQPLRLRLSRAVPDAEWCGYYVYVPGDGFDEGEFPSGAGVLQPRIGPPPPPLAPLTPQTPGVRIGVTTEADELDGSDLLGEPGDATFLTAGNVLTVRLAEPRPRSTIVNLGCGAGDRVLGGRSMAIQGARRVFTIDAGADLGGAAWCIIEDGLFGDDLAAALLQPSGAVPSQVPSAP